MSVQPLANVILDIRADVEDAANDNLAVDETIGGKQDSNNTRFTLQHDPVIDTNPPGLLELRKIFNLTTTVLVRNDPTPGPGQYSLNPARGIITLGTPPVNESEQYFATYYWIWYPDNDYAGWVLDSCEFLGFPSLLVDTTANSQMNRAADALIKVQDGLMQSLKSYASYRYWKRRGSQWAQQFSSSSAGVVTSGIDKVAEKYEMLSKSALANAFKLRDDFYTNFSQNLTPAAAQVVGVQGLPSPYGPRR